MKKIKLTKRQRKLPLWMQLKLLQGFTEEQILQFLINKL